MTVEPACRVAAAAVRRCPAEGIGRLRDELAPAHPNVSAATLKQIDDQTLLMVAAVRAAGPLPGSGWGVVACPRLPGRKRMAELLGKFRESGAWAVTPHFIPHALLHSASGLVSQAFDLHGPNVGVGGMPGREAEATRRRLRLDRRRRCAGRLGVLGRVDGRSAGAGRRVLGRRRGPGAGRRRTGRPGVVPAGPAAAERGMDGRADRSQPGRGGAGMNRSEPVWITGAGVGVPHGWDFATAAEGLLAGRSTVVKVSHFDVAQHPSQIGAPLGPVPHPPGVDEAAFAAASRLEQLDLWCCSRALHDAGLWKRRGELRIGLVLGNAGECPWSWEEALRRRPHQQPCDPAYDHDPIIETPRRVLGLNGPAVALSTACASGNFALSVARRWLQAGWVDVCLAGGCDVALTPLVLAGFGNLRALSRRNDDPLRGVAGRSTRGRDGFVLGEGGVVFVLERAADARNARPRCTANSPASGWRATPTTWSSRARSRPSRSLAVRRALADAGVDPSRTSTTSTPTPRARRSATSPRQGPARGVRRRLAAGAGQLDQEHDGPPADGGGGRRGAGVPGRDASTGPCRRRSTSTTPTPSATSATSPTRPGRNRCASPCRTRSASAAATVAAAFRRV